MCSHLLKGVHSFCSSRPVALVNLDLVLLFVKMSLKSNVMEYKDIFETVNGMEKVKGVSIG